MVTGALKEIEELLKPNVPPPEEMKLRQKFYVIGEKGWGISEDSETFVSPEWEQFSLAEMQTRFGEAGVGNVVYDFERDMFVPTTEEQVRQREQWIWELEAKGLTLPKRIEELPATIEDWNTRIAEERARTETIFKTAFPGTTASEVRDMLGAMVIREGATFEDIDAAVAAQDEFLQAVKDIGKTPEMELFISTIFPLATTEDVNALFGIEAKAEVPTEIPPQAVLELEPEWENFRTGEVITSSEKERRYPKGYEAELDEWRLTAETGRNYIHVFRVFGEALTKLPKQWGAAILQAIQGKGGASVVDKDWADRYIEEANTDIEEFSRDVLDRYGETRLPIKMTDLATLPQNMAFSLTAMGAGLGAGVPIAFAPVPGARVAAWAAGTIASGAVAYNMSTYQIMQSYLELKNDEMMARAGRGLNAEEEELLKRDFSNLAMKYGLWEAIPEALSNLAFARILTLPLGGMVGRSTATRIISKLVGIYGEELLTETITQKGQSAIEVEAGLREGRITWIEAFKEIAPQTFLLTTILGGAGQIGISSVNKIKQSLRKEVGFNPDKKVVYDAIKDNLTEDVFAEIEAEAVVAEEKRIIPEVAKATLSLEEISELETRIPLDLIRKDEPKTLARLTEKIKREGITEPITIRVREDGSRIVWDGIHRLIVAQDLGIKNVPVKYIGEVARLKPEVPPAIPEAVTPKVTIPKPTRPVTEAEKPALAEYYHKEATRWREIAEKETLKEPSKEGEQRYATAILKAEEFERQAKELEVIPPVVEEVKPAEIVPEVEEEVRRNLDELQKMHDYWRNKLKTSEETKASLAKFVRENLPVNVRGKYITAVAKVKTDAQLQTQIGKVSEFAEFNAQKVLKAEIRKEIKKAQAKVKDHILKGKFTPEVQRRLDVLTHNLELDRDTAREKMAVNIEAYDEGKLGYEEMLQDNELLNFAGIEGMSAEELANTLEYIKTLETIGKSERQAKQELATERINATRSDISNILTGGQGLKTGIGAIPTGELVAKTGWWDTFTNWQYGIDNLADKISKLDPTSKPYQSALSKFVAQVHRATFRQVAGTKEAFNKIKNIVGEVYKVKGTHDINQVLNALEEEVNLGVFELTEEYKANHPGATTVAMKMTRNQMIAKYMQMQDPTLSDTFTTGMGWSQNVKDAVTNNLTIEEKKLSDAMFGFYEDYYTATNEIYQELYNVDMPHNPVYSPIRRDFEADIVENVLTIRDASQYASVLNGSLKARQRNIRPLRFNGALDILSNHIQQMEHFKAWATTMRDMRRVFGNKQIRQAVEQYHGRGVLKLIDTFLSQMARGGIETATTNRAADFLRRNFTKSILAIKPVIMLKQIPSLFGYVSEMKVTEFVGGIADFWISPVKNFRFLYANSKMFRARMEQGFERDIRAAMQKHGKKLISGKGKLTDWFMLQIRLGDTFAVTQGMWAKYKAGLKEGLSQADAIAAAEDTTGRTQPSFGIDTLSAIQNGGSWLKLMTMFQNQPNKYFRMEADNLRNFRYGRGSRAKAASTILLVHCLLPMMFQFIADAFQWKPERQARAGILGPLNFILIGGQLVQSIWGWLTDQPFDYQISPVAQTGRDLQMIFLKAKKMVEQGLDPYKDISLDDAAALIEYLAKATGQVIGLPTPYFVQLSKQLRHLEEAGEEIEVKHFLFSEWALKPPEKNAEQKVEDANLKLGEVKEGQEDKPLTERELKIYTTIDWLNEIGDVYSNVLPQDVLDNPKSSKESKAWAEYEIARSKADILPNVPLYKINTEDNDDTIINYYQQWQARQRIVSISESKGVLYFGTLEELREFDKLYPKAFLGNVDRATYQLLKSYLEADDKDTFLNDHPQLRVNPRNEWLKANPKGNALLALGRQAKILTKEAYTQFKAMLKDLDIPDSAIPPLTLPPETSIDTHFKYEEMVTDGKHGSWEAQLLLLKDAETAKEAGVESYAEWKGLTLSETPVRSLELKIKHRELFEQYETLETDEERAELKADNPEWIDDMRRIEAIEHEASDDVIESWVDRGRRIDEFGGGSSEAKVWLVDHKEVWDWALEQELLTDDGSDWNVPVLRINANYRTEDEEYDTGIPDRFKDIINLDERADKIARARADYLTENIKYYKARYRRDAYSIVGDAPNYLHFPENLIETYVEWNTDASLKKPEDWDDKLGWYEDDWWLMEHTEFEQAMLDTGQWKEKRDFSKVPTKEVFEKWQQYNDLIEGKPRDDLRWENRDLDAWLLLTGKVSVSIEEKKRRAKLTQVEKVREQLKEIEELLKP